MPDESTAPPPATGTTASPAPEPAPTEDWATRFKYLLADFENYRRRSERERESISRQSRGAMLRELLPILEAVRLAHGALDRLPASDPLRRGLDLVEHEWSKFLKHEGVEPVAVVGEPFRADEAEAVGESPATADRPAGSVAEVVQQGYRFFGGLLRPAKVVIARTPPVPEGPGSATEAVGTSSEGKE